MKQSIKSVGNKTGIVISIVLIVFFTLFIQTKSIEKAKQSIGASLNTILETTSQSLISWSRQQRREAISWADASVVKLTTAELLKENLTTNQLISSEAQKNLRKVLKPVLSAKQYRGYFVISKNKKNLASSRNNNIGSKSFIDDAFLLKIWSGSTAISVPVKSDVVLRDENGIPLEDQVSMFVGAPIYNDKDQVVAALTFRIDPASSFYKLLERGRVGESGETYALTSQGLMVSRSRFETDLSKYGILKNRQTSATNIKVLDPEINLIENDITQVGADLSLTRMAKSINLKESNYDFDGYNDYRGVMVVGSWVWIEELSLGLATEIDKSEALAGASFNNLFSGIFAIIVVLLIIGLTLLQNKSNKVIHEKEAYLNSVIDTASQAFITTNKFGIITAFNHYAETMFGYKAEEIIGRSVNVLMGRELGHKHDEILTKYFDTYDKRSRVLIKSESVALKKDNTEFSIFVSTSVSVVNDEIVCSGVFHDLTSINKAKDDLLKLNEELEERVLLRTKEAVNAAEAKSEFLANMSHEIRTPLNAITGFNNLLFNTKLDDEQNIYVKNLERASNSLLSLINDILDFSKIEAGMLDIEEEEFTLDELFENLSAILNVKTDEKHLEFVFEVGEGVPRSVKGDVTRLNQVLINLCNNAVKFTHTGEVKVSIGLQIQTRNELVLKFSVSDTGIGIPKKSLETLFDAFTQADTSTTRKFGGTGLGLTISTKLVELMGGELKVQSEEGVGSTFGFSIPLKAGDENTEWTKINTSLNGKKILLVEDNETTQLILSNILRKSKFDVKVASSGEEALELVKDSEFDIILMDMLMPGMNGIEASQSIKSKDFKNAPVVIMITGLSADQVIKKAKAAGIEGYIQKPINPCQLIHTINGVLGFGVTDELKSAHGKKLISDKLGQARSILLVEDNELNQIVAINILEKAGFVITLAKNGKDAVLEAEKGKFDIVLMDIQMPVMGGYEATELIRKNNSDLPIVAMTANAQLSDKEKAFRVGMNDYISKPLDPRKLFDVIEKWVGDEERTDVLGASEVSETEENKIFDYDECLERFVGERELLLEAVERFNDTQIQEVDKIKKAFEENDLEALRNRSHALKGSSGNMAMKSMYEELLQIEIMINQNNIPALKEPIGKLKAIAEDTYRELGLFLKKSSE